MVHNKLHTKFALIDDCVTPFSFCYARKTYFLKKYINKHRLIKLNQWFLITIKEKYHGKINVV